MRYNALTNKKIALGNLFLRVILINDRLFDYTATIIPYA